MPTFPGRPTCARGASDLRRSRREPAGTRGCSSASRRTAIARAGGEIVNPDPRQDQEAVRTARCGRRSRSAVHPTHASRAGSVLAAASKSRQPRRRPSRSRTNQRRCGPNTGTAEPVVPVNQFAATSAGSVAKCSDSGSSPAKSAGSDECSASPAGSTPSSASSSLARKLVRAPRAAAKNVVDARLPSLRLHRAKRKGSS